LWSLHGVNTLFLIKPTHRKHRSLSALLFASLANLASMQDEPVVGIDHKLRRNALEQFLQHGQRSFSLCQAVAVAHAKELRFEVDQRINC